MLKLSAIALELDNPGDTITFNDAIASFGGINLYRVQLEAREGLTFDLDLSEQGSILGTWGIINL